MTEQTPAARALEGRIFLVGVPRSGTTLLQSLLAAHSRVTSFTESHLFSRPFRSVPGLGPILAEDPTPRLREFLVENRASATEVASWFGPPTPPELTSKIGLATHTGSVARRLVGVLDALALQRGTPVWLEKTPRHLQALSLLEAVCDDGVPTRFVHLFRDGLQTVASLFAASRHWPETYDLETCIDRWNGDLARSARFIGRADHYFVRYDTLARSPEAVLRPLFAALDLGWESEVLAGFGDAADPLHTAEETWKAGVARRIEPSATAGDVLDAAQRKRVAASLDPEAYERLREVALGEPHRA